MRNDKQTIINLRKTGKSYNEISKTLRIPKSTLSDWLKNTSWSKKIKLHLDTKTRKLHSIRLKELGKIKKQNLARAYQQAKAEAKTEFNALKYHPLFISGLSIYWGEGDKSTHHTARIGNVDPLLIRVFVKFLVEICGVPKNNIKAYVLLYPDLDDNTCKNFWIAQSGLDSTNFTKSIKIQGRHKTRRLTYGVCTVGYSSTYFKVKIYEWLKLLSAELLKHQYTRL